MARWRTLIGISVFWVALGTLGDGFTALVVPYGLATSADPAWVATVVGAVTFIGLLAGALVQPVAGTISDRLYGRYGRRGPLVVGAALIVAAVWVFALVGDVVGLLIAFVLVQVAASIAQAPLQGFIPDQVRPSWRGRAAGAKGLADVGGAFLGFLVLGGLLAAGGTGYAAAFVTLVVVVALAVTLILVREPRRTATPAAASVTPATASVWREAFKLPAGGQRDLLRVIAGRFLFLFGIFAVGRFLLLFVADRLGLDPTAAADEAGMALAALTLVTAVASLPAGWIADRYGRVPIMVAGSVVAATGTLLLLATSSLVQVVAFGGLMAVGSALFMGANWALTADLAPRSEAARTFALANFGTAGAAAAAGLLGPLADITRSLSPSVGYGAVLVAAAIAIVAAIGVVVRISAPAARAPEPARIPPPLEEVSRP
jgi:MFS family permease